MALRKQPKSELDQLRAQRQELAGRLEKSEQRAANLDPLDQWEELSQLTSEIQSLERAIATADKRIEAAERAAAAATVAEREAARSERATAARVNLEAVARRLCDELQQLDAGLLADLDAAGRELGAAGGYPSPQIGPALEIRGAVRVSLERWRGLAPLWFGLPAPLSRVEEALADRRKQLERAESLLANMRQEARKSRYHGEATVPTSLLTTLAHGVEGARRSLLALTEPELTGDELFKRTTAGLNELDTYAGRFWEARRQEEFQKQQAALV